MNTSIFLIVVWFVGPYVQIKIEPMPSMRACTSIGEWLQGASKDVAFTCIEDSL